MLNRSKMNTQKIVINRCFGGFGLSNEAYEWLLAHGIPLKKYVEQKQDPETGRYLPEPLNGGEVIFDRRQSEDRLMQSLERLTKTRYWDGWTRESRTHPLLVQVVEELGSERASGCLAKLAVVEVPAGVEWEIEDYDGLETIHEKHKSWS